MNDDDDEIEQRFEPFEAIFTEGEPGYNEPYVTKYDQENPDSARRAREHKRALTSTQKAKARKVTIHVITE
jgi:hypothetical protein